MLPLNSAINHMQDSVFHCACVYIVHSHTQHADQLACQLVNIYNNIKFIFSFITLILYM